jgi:hypothetical protein
VLMVLVFRFSMRVFRGLGTKCWQFRGCDSAIDLSQAWERYARGQVLFHHPVGCATFVTRSRNRAISISKSASHLSLWFSPVPWTWAISLASRSPSSAPANQFKCQERI